MEQLTQHMTFPPTKDQTQEFESIDNIRTKARKQGLVNCKKIYVSGIVSHPEIKKVRLKIRLIDNIISRQEGKKSVKWRTVVNLSKHLNERALFDMNNNQLLCQRREARKTFYRLKKTCGVARTTEFEEKAQDHKNRGEWEEAKLIHAKLTREKQREQAARLRQLKAKEDRGGVRSVLTEHKQVDNKGDLIIGADGKAVTITKEIHEQKELEQVCMKEVSNRSRMSEGTPPMISPLVDLLKYNSITDYADKILLGTAELLPDIDEHTQLYLDQLKAVKGVLPEKAEPAPFSQYCREVNKLRERTSSGASNVTPAMIKTECLDPYIANTNWNASNFPWCTGYSPRRYRTGLDLLIHKRANDNRVDRLRPILLFDLEANMHNKRLGKEAMQRAEECHGIAPEQYGSRKKKAADIQALNTRLFYDYVQLKRTPATSLFIDLVSNYDLVAHNIATLALQRVGTPKAPICCMFSTLQDMVHTVRTAYGDSIDSYGGDLWILKLEPPPQGLGQGNGAAPATWALVSSPLLNVLRSKGYGVVFKCAISKKEFKIVGYCFVDDSTIIQMAPTPETPTEETVKIAQSELDIYAGLAAATGGKVSQARGKNSWYLIEFQWHDDGKWSLVENKADIYVKSKTGQTKVDRLPSDMASRILGVWLAPNGDSTTQTKELLALTTAWADRVRTGHLKQGDAWTYYQTTIQKSLEYPLLATTLSEEQCRKVEQPALTVALHSSSLPSNFPRDILYGPKGKLGLGASQLFTTQGLKHIQAILNHGNLDDITGQQIRANIELHKLKLGTRTSLFRSNPKVFGICTTSSWLTHTWDFMWKYNCIIEEETPCLSLQREKDVFIMEAFAAAGYQGAKLATLNRCRQFLRAVTLADITSGDGKQVLPMTLTGKRVTTETPYDWPPQGPLSNKYWKEWEIAVKDTFDVERNHLLPFKSQLGKWLNSCTAPDGNSHLQKMGYMKRKVVSGLDFLQFSKEEAGTHIEDITEQELKAHHQ